MWGTDYPYYARDAAKKSHEDLISHFLRVQALKVEAINEEMDKRMEGADETQELTHILTRALVSEKMPPIPPAKCTCVSTKECAS